MRELTTGEPIRLAIDHQVSSYDGLDTVQLPLRETKVGRPALFVPGAGGADPPSHHSIINAASSS